MDPPRGPHSLIYSVILSLHKISVKIMTICCLSDLDGSKIKKIQDFGQF